MNDNLRAVIAYLVASYSNQKTKNSVFDYTRSQHINISGNVAKNQVQLFDHNAGAHITGSLPNLFHHGLGAHFSIEKNGDQFKGFDFGSGTHWTGKISGNNVTIFDYTQGQHFIYQV
ncbi:MAG: hypothetical protein HOP24_10260 [Sideroxydans sp.]|nr:hypothetical protein [Sideroxydans sp.]